MSSNSESKVILLTGGAGFIGSHNAVDILESGYDVVVVDNLINSSTESLKRVEKITNKKVTFYEESFGNYKAMTEIFRKHNIYAVIHFGALKSVPRSILRPLDYYDNNIANAINLLKVMEENNCFNFIFSSSSTVYGTMPKPFHELTNLNEAWITNPYGKTKYIFEMILKDICERDKRWNVMILRYFNPVGSHKSGLLGENPKLRPLNLMPYISQVAIGNYPHVNVFGNDYDTKDGTGARDYTHIDDIVNGHTIALKNLRPGCKIYNLGSGKPYSVLEMIKLMEKATGKTIPYKICPRREGDIGEMYCDISLAKSELGWEPKKTAEDMCVDLWRFQTMNPNGYE